MSNNVLVLIPKKLIRYIDFFYEFFIKYLTDNNFIITIVHKPSNNISHIDISDIRFIFVYQQIYFYGGMIRRILLNDKFKGEIKFISTECTSCEKHQEIIEHNMGFIRSIDYNLKIYDYSKENIINYINRYKLNTSILNVLEPNYNYLKHDIKKDIDIGIYLRFCNEEFKENYFNKFRKRARNMVGLWKGERLNFVKRCKIFVNVHASKDFKICETHRVYELIAARCIVISQRCMYENDITLSKYIIFVDDDKLVDKIFDVLNNYDKYYKKIYNNITNEEIFSDINNQWNELII